MHNNTDTKCVHRNVLARTMEKIRRKRRTKKKTQMRKAKDDGAKRSKKEEEEEEEKNSSEYDEIGMTGACLSQFIIRYVGAYIFLLH